MAKNTKPQSKQPTWTDVKAKLADFDRAALLDLIRSLYSANKDNQVFLHSRFGLGGDVLEPYKKIIDRWLSPDVLRNQDVSVSQAKQAISDYKKAVGDPEGVAELMVFYCEQAAGFCHDICNDDEGYFNALVRMFEQALKSANELSADRQDDLVSRLNRVRTISHDFGYGVEDDMDFLLAKYTRSWRSSSSNPESLLAFVPGGRRLTDNGRSSRRGNRSFSPSRIRLRGNV
jgi:hypothetical protein